MCVSPTRLYTFIFLDDAFSVGNDAMYSPSLHLKTMPKSSFVIDKETTSALFISLTRDTENYLNETVNGLAETIIKLVQPVSIVMSTALFSEPFSAVTEIPDTAVTAGFPSPRASTMASVPDWPKTRYACHGEPLTQMVDKSDEI